MIGLLKNELLKLNRSLVLLVLLGIPGVLYLLEVAIVATGNGFITTFTLPVIVAVQFVFASLYASTV